MARATLFDPVTRQRKAVDIGSTENRDLFSKGWKLETPTQNLSTWSATPSREIVTTPGSPQLSARDNATGTVTPIANPAELSRLVNQGGYQDTRAPLSFGGSSPTTTPPPTQTPSITGGQPKPNISDSYNAAIAALLKSMQGGSGLDADLLKQRNDLINQRFNNVNASPSNPMLSPSQNRSLSNLQNQGVEDRLSGVNTALQARERQRGEAKDQMQMVLDTIKEERQALKDDAEATNKLRDDARATLQFALNNNPDAIREMKTEQRREWEDSAGYPKGFLDSLATTKTIKEETLDVRKATADKGRYKVIAATKYHPTLYFDSSTGQYYDAKTGKATTAPAGSGAGTTASGTSSGKKTTAAAIPKTLYDRQKAELEASKGPDGKANTDTYKRLRSELKSTYQTSFDRNFSYMLNPNDPTAQAFLPKKSTTNTNVQRYTSKNVPQSLLTEITTNIQAGHDLPTLLKTYDDVDSAYITKLYKDVNNY